MIVTNITEFNKIPFSAGSSEWDFERRRGCWHVVEHLTSCGLNVMPLRVDGSKAPAIKWLPYQLDEVPYSLLWSYFRNRYRDYGIGVICGVTSGHLEILDFDGPQLFEPWCQAAESILGDALYDMPVIQTPKGGYHLYYRCDPVGGNTKLAYSADKQIQIETRGQGGQAVMAGSPPRTHPKSKPYRLISGDFATIPKITESQRDRAFGVARSFDLSPPPEMTREQRLKEICGENIGAAGERPGDDFNSRGPSWEDLLSPHGWYLTRVVGGIGYWQRPGKTGDGFSATTGYCGDLLYVFSTNAAPFEGGKAYSKYAVYTYINHKGDWSQSARTLATEGYGRGILTRSEEEIHKCYEGITNEF